jgi:hypothetical protein
MVESLSALAHMLYHELQTEANSPTYQELDKVQAARLKGIINQASRALPEHAAFFNNIQRDTIWTGTTWSVKEAISILEYIMKLGALQSNIDKKNREGKVFATAEEKLKESAASLSRDDFVGVINNLNTALELALKDRLGIPNTISRVRTGRIIDVLVARKLGPYRYLIEAQKHVLQLDNKVKHQGYLPSKADCISALKATEDLLQKLKAWRVKLTKEVQNEVFEAL